MEIHRVRIEYFQNEGVSNHEFGIKFIKNLRFFNIYASNLEKRNEWRTAFSKHFIQSDFHTKFKVLKVIGKGGFAKVYLVEENEKPLNQFAVKAFSKDFILSQSTGRDSLLNEVDLLHYCNHKNILRLEELHETKNSVYLVMEMLSGGELLDKIMDKKLTKNDDIKKVMGNLLSSLSYLDRKNIMHRDLKPENIILKNKDDLTNICLVDFGLASKVDAKEYIFKRCGTPGFVAPEIINASSDDNIKFSTKVDVFSAGIIFYLLLTNKFPFDGSHYKQVLAANKKCNIDFTLPALKKADPHAVDLLKKMCLEDPVKRISANDALKHHYLSSLGMVNKSEENFDLIDMNEDIKKSINQYKQNYLNALGQEKVDTQGSFFIQGKYIKGEIQSIGLSKGDFDKNVAPQSIEMGKKPPLLRGSSDRKFNKGSGANSLLKTALKNNMNNDSPKAGPVLIADSFESLGSGENDSQGSAGSQSPKEESKKNNEVPSSTVPPKLKNKASSFRNPKQKLD